MESSYLVNNMTTLKSLFNGLQKRMCAELNCSSALNHPVDNGDNSEESWRKWLSNYLPQRYKVDKATIIDSKGGISEQIDAVVYDAQYSYLAFNENDILYLPAESVYAVFEIKPTLNKGYLDYAAQKAASVRALYRTSVPIPHAGGTYKAKTPLPILAGILTTNSTWKPLFGNTLKKHLKTHIGNQRLDCGCVISEGSFFADWTQMQLKQCEGKNSLVSFFLQLLIELQKMGTVPAIDLAAYAKMIKIQKTTL